MFLESTDGKILGNVIQRLSANDVISAKKIGKAGPLQESPLWFQGELRHYTTAWPRPNLTSIAVGTAPPGIITILTENE